MKSREVAQAAVRLFQIRLEQERDVTVLVVAEGYLVRQHR